MGSNVHLSWIRFTATVIRFFAAKTLKITISTRPAFGVRSTQTLVEIYNKPIIKSSEKDFHLGPAFSRYLM